MPNDPNRHRLHTDRLTLIACTPGSFASGSTIVTCDFRSNPADDLTGTAVDVANAFDLSVIDAGGQTSRN